MQKNKEDMFKKNYNQNDSKKALVDSRTRKRIFHVVLITHIIVISVILLWGLAVEFFKPKRPKILTVSLYTPPKNPGPPAYTPPKAVKTVKTPKKKSTKKKPRKKPKKKPKKKWKPAKKIKVSKKMVYVRPKKTKPRIKAIDKQKLINSLKQKNVKIRSNQNTGITQSYESNVGAYLYQLWNTPDKSVLGNKHPEVKIQLNIAANGQLVYAKILKPSGVTAMDKSVQELLKKVKYLPKPSGGAKKITLILEVID